MFYEHADEIKYLYYMNEGILPCPTKTAFEPNIYFYSADVTWHS